MNHIEQETCHEKTFVLSSVHNQRHWVGNGFFRCAAVFSYKRAAELTPFCCSTTGPGDICAVQRAQGVASIRTAFETVTIVYAGVRSSIAIRRACGAHHRPGDVNG